MGSDKSNQIEGEQNSDNRSNKRSRLFLTAIIVGVALAAAGGVVALLFAFNVLGGVDQTSYSINYTITPITVTGHLDVAMDIDVHRLSKDRDILLYVADIKAESVECIDGAGNEVPVTETDDLFAIGPIEDGVEKLLFKYSVLVGEINADFDINSIPYSKGIILEDLITFSGEYTLLLPFLDPNSFDSIGKYIKNLTFQFAVPDDFDAIIPYQTPISGAHTISVDKPDWDFFNAISKSAFSFGRFEKLNDYVPFRDAPIYIDTALLGDVSEYSVQALRELIDYYTDLFGESLTDVPILLLRNLEYENTVITSGAGSGGSAMSLNMRLADDVKTMSNMVYHTFFDSIVKARNLRYTGNGWIYRGLSEYYVAASARRLSEEIVEEFEIADTATIYERYLRYLYFSLKEPGFLGISPIHETTGMYIAQEEFYMGVKTPLMIETINYAAERKTGQSDGFIRALIKNGKTTKQIDVTKLLKEICGSDYDMIEKYLSGQALIPNYLNISVDEIPAISILTLLDEDELMYATYFNQENIYYPYMTPILLNEEPFMAAVSERGIRYNTDEIQNEVKGFSTVLNRLLLQYAMWASMAGIDDITQPNIKQAIAQPEVLDEWRAFCDDIGDEFGAIGYDEANFDESYDEPYDDE